MTIKQEINATLILTIGAVGGFLFLVIVIGLQAWFLWAEQIEVRSKWDATGLGDAAIMIQEQQARISNYAITGDGRAVIPIDVAMKAIVESGGRLPAPQPAESPAR